MLAAKLHLRRRQSLSKSQHVMCLFGVRAGRRSHASFRSYTNYGVAWNRGKRLTDPASSHHMGLPLMRPSLPQGNYCCTGRSCCNHRFFSKFSTDSNEAVVQDLVPRIQPSSASTSLSPLFEDKEGEEGGNKTRLSVDYMKPASIKMKHLLALKEAYLTLSKACFDAQSLLNSNADASSSDELIAMADYFLILVNDVDLESSIETIQTLQYNDELLLGDNEKGGDSVTKEILGQAQRALSRLHNVFLRVVECCIPPADYTVDSSTLGSTMSSNEHVSCSKYSAMTMGRALQVSRRAEELGMPMHKPLYQRMAVGIVLTSPIRVPCRHPGRWPWEQNSAQDDDDDVVVGTDKDQKKDVQQHPPKLILPGHSQQVKEGLYTPPLTMEILNLCHRAKVALKCSFFPSMPLNKQMEQSRRQHQLELDIYSEPWLLMLKRRQFEEALSLLRGWESNFGSSQSGSKPKINLLALLEEDTISKALEIAKDWVEGSSFPEHVSSDPHANELIDVLQHSLAGILRRRKVAAEEMAQFINALAAVHRTRPEEDEDFSDSDSDFEEFDFEEFDSDSEDEDDEAVVLGELRNDVTAENFPLFLKGVGLDNTLDRTNTIGTNSNNGAGASSREEKSCSQEIVEEDDEPPLIHGISNDDVRRSIYLRKGPDWELPDIVPQLESWNKGKPLSFTPEFERYLGWQLSKDDDDDDDHYD